MMNAYRSFQYENNEELGYTSLSLPYFGEEYEMTIYLQEADHQNHEEHLVDLCHQVALKHFNSERSNTNVMVHIPKMKISTKASVMKALKLDDILRHPNLSDMITINDIVDGTKITHAAELEADEKGTVGSAVTDAQLPLIVSGPLSFHVNKPFLMTITHKLTNTNLFLGYIRRPIQ